MTSPRRTRAVVVALGRMPKALAQRKSRGSRPLSGRSRPASSARALQRWTAPRSRSSAPASSTIDCMSCLPTARQSKPSTFIRWARRPRPRRTATPFASTRSSLTR
eukprot:Amastigsp_a8242_19.p4 type:complete len:106 gc:universal Amastigsp_a8242_19:596-913(+)